MYQVRNKHYFFVVLMLILMCERRPNLSRDDVKECTWKYSEGYYLGQDIITFHPDSKGYRTLLCIDEKKDVYNDRGEYLGKFLETPRFKMELNILSPKG